MISAPGDGLSGTLYNEWMFAEAAAIPSYPHKGQIIIPGIASPSSSANVAVRSALAYVKGHQRELRELFGGPPYIDINRLVRLSFKDDNDPDNRYPPRGEPLTGHADVDVILHVPPYVDVTFLAPAMVIAIVMMQWRLRSAPLQWSAVGSFDPEGNLYGYPFMDQTYVNACKNWGFKHMLLPKANAEQFLALAQGNDGMEVLGCNNVFDMVIAIKNGDGFTTDPAS